MKPVASLSSHHSPFRIQWNRAIVSWLLYDIASSGYVLMVPSIAYAVYYRQTVCGGFPVCDARWAIWVSLALVIAGVVSPFLGAIADLRGDRHHLFISTVLLCTAATAALYWVQPGMLLAGGIVFLLAQVGYFLAASLYDAYIPDLVPPRQAIRLSGLGWGLGFLGGIACYLLFIALSRASYADETVPYRLTFLAVAIFMAGLALPAFAWLPRQSKRVARSSGPIAYQAYGKVVQTVSNWRQNSNIFRFLLGFYLLSDGITTINSFTGIYLSTQFRLTIAQILLLTLLFNLIAIPSTILWSVLSDRWSAKTGLTIMTGIWTLTLLLMIFGTHTLTPILIVASLGMVMGSTQSLCRGLFAQMVYASQATEMFGFNALVSKVSAIMGPLMFGVISSTTGSQRLAMASLLILFLLGGWILIRIPFEAADAVQTGDHV